MGSPPTCGGCGAASAAERGATVTLREGCDPVFAQGLRGRITLPEVILWRYLKEGKLHGLRFRNQHSLLGFVLDFYCADRLLAVEVDGRQHDEPEVARRDAWRDRRLAEEKGVLTLRFSAVDVLAGDEPLGVLDRIAEVALARPSVRGGGRRRGVAPRSTLTRSAPPTSGG